MKTYKIYITEMCEDLVIVNHYEFVNYFEDDLTAIHYTLKMLKNIMDSSSIKYIEYYDTDCEIDYEVKIISHGDDIMSAHF